ncbi:hypothetical protein Cni_G00578 [Canna indica]|uniref:Uncharacterized protein n=1 Tax=Canna indica TaxID=4628 RepID=A0AAQ3JLK6_9LILI|nr:hypothetical protein Cni_G00577 [Canna indica]WOK91887.1 hypothetical protein Cni_G00578 [Canna indica]
MARLLLFALLSAGFFATVSVGRPSPAVVQSDAMELNKLVLADAPTGGFPAKEVKMGLASAPGSLIRHWKHHHRIDKSVAGAEVILGGLAVAIIIAVICYIRVTRKRVDDIKA